MQEIFTNTEVCPDIPRYFLYFFFLILSLEPVTQGSLSGFCLPTFSSSEILRCHAYFIVLGMCDYEPGLATR